MSGMVSDPSVLLVEPSAMQARIGKTGDITHQIDNRHLGKFPTTGC